MYGLMQAFADLLDRLVLTPSRNGKLRLMMAYFAAAPDPDRGYALGALTGDLDIPGVKPAMIRDLIADRMDAGLFAMSYDYVGDLAETVSLVWPGDRRANRPPPLSDIVETLSGASRAEAPGLVAGWLDDLDTTGRWALLKLMTGGLRIGVSARLAKLALAQFGEKDVTDIEEIWHGLASPYESLFAWLEDRAEKPAPDIAAPFRPVMLAHPLVPKADRGNPDALDPALIRPDTFAAEWKFDGIRVQASAERGTRRIYTRTGDDISRTFPDVVAAMDFEGTLDGELLVRTTDGAVAPFNALQQRLNRKTVSKRQMETHPAFIRTYDILQDGGTDLRARPFRARRQSLEAFVAGLSPARFDLSPLVPVTDIAALDAARLAPPSPEIEGLMLKRWDSAYVAGRPKGLWYKWKRDPYLVDAVLMYAQRGHGKRSSFYSDFTFGVWRAAGGEDELTPVGKAYFGFTDAELKQLDAFVRANTIERFGPVRSVTANKETGIVLEVAFEGLQRSPRHKSGIAMRFPRINRIRWDKPTAEADRLETLVALLPD
ncbi:ATP-dependent DNA ligase [Hyphomonas johnsonii MHS-2]|uniref:DNA ligase (ATP) n=2 Tax=Hyphomonas johnsonii TaxID=81031 RepID=A0A059FJ79_9PROT|nr:ATP-dependent DNA ligase [Hyphomonas johnsonii MHS-2]